MHAAGRNVSLALAQKHDFNPWTVPDDYTVYKFAPDYVKPLLHPHWQTQKAVHPIYAYFFGMFYLVMGKLIFECSQVLTFIIIHACTCDWPVGSCAIFGNILVLKIFSHYKSLRTPANMLVMNLAISDLLLMISLIPEAVYNFFCGGPWQFGDLGCQIHAFCGQLLILPLDFSGLINGF